MNQLFMVSNSLELEVSARSFSDIFRFAQATCGSEGAVMRNIFAGSFQDMDGHVRSGDGERMVLNNN
jgi:hypothetical protein